MGPTPRRRAIILFVLLVFLYLSNLRDLSPDDTVATRYLPFSIVTRHSLNVDPYVDLHVHQYLNGMIGYGPYFAAHVNGHWMSAYPIVTSLVVTPLFVAPAIWAEHRGIQPGSTAMRFVALTVEKFSAAILTALGAVFIYLAMRSLLSDRGAMLLTLVYAVASPTWMISGQALWLENLSELSLAMLIWALITDRGTRRSAVWIGLSLALAVANKLTNALIAFPVIAWLCLRELRRHETGAGKTPAARLSAFFIPLVALGIFVLWYNFHYFGDILGAYRWTFEDIGYTGVAAGFRGGWSAFFDGASGLLVSPNRGLFVFVPWTVLTIWGAVRLWRESPFGWARWLLAGSFFAYLMYAKLERWYGGYTFGPRYLVELMPVLALCMVPVWRWASTFPRRAIVTALVLVSLAIQCIGVFNYPGGTWNELPVSVDIVPERVWDWHDLQIVRVLRAGPAVTHVREHLQGYHQTF